VGFNEAQNDGLAVASAGPHANYLHLAPHQHNITQIRNIAHVQPIVSKHWRQILHSSNCVSNVSSHRPTSVVWIDCIMVCDSVLWHVVGEPWTVERWRAGPSTRGRRCSLRWRSSQRGALMSTFAVTNQKIYLKVA